MSGNTRGIRQANPFVSRLDKMLTPNPLFRAGRSRWTGSSRDTGGESGFQPSFMRMMGVSNGRRAGFGKHGPRCLLSKRAVAC